MDAPNQQPPIADLLPRRNGNRNRSDLSVLERKRLVSFFLARCSNVDGVQVPARGTAVAAAIFFGIDRTTAARIWKTASDNNNNPDIGYYRTTPQKKGKCGRKQIYDFDILESTVADLPRDNRKTIRGVALGLGVSTSTVQKMLKQNIIRKSSNPLKVVLTDNNKWMRLEYAVGQIDRTENGVHKRTEAPG
jgi:antitoxin component of RelBE/YafQ-DinJ toxin-antitoxin module